MRCTRLIALAMMLTPGVAAAHIRITSPTPRSDSELKDRHCGQTGSTRANVLTKKPGATIHLVWDEYVQHPGWFRISFQKNGDVFEVPPPSTGDNSKGDKSNYPTEDLTGKTDPVTGALIIADRIPHPALSMDVKLPNIECSNCTLQLTQMMTEGTTYSAGPGSGNIYYACVDLVLSNGTSPPPPTIDAGPTSPPPQPSSDASVPAPGIDAGTSGTSGPDGGLTGSDGTSSGGCATTGGTSSLALLGLALLGLRRRR